MRTQFHQRPHPDGKQFWDIGKILARSSHLPVIDLPLEKLKELDENWWFQDGEVPSARLIAHHIHLIQMADLSYPILLCSEGRLMDGMHRAIKAVLQGDSTIKAIQLDETPPPDHVGLSSPDSD